MNMPSNWRKIDERIEYDSRVRLGGMDLDSTMMVTYDGVMFGRLYHSQNKLKCIINKHSLAQATNFRESLSLDDVELLKLPRREDMDFQRYDLVEHDYLRLRKLDKDVRP